MSDLLLAFDALDRQVADSDRLRPVQSESIRCRLRTIRRDLEAALSRPTPILVTEAMAQAREQGGMDRGQFRLAAVQNQI